MKNRQLIQDIINLPIVFYTNDDYSMYTLLEQTGYFKNFVEVNEEDILKILTEDLKPIEFWFQWSESKRTNEGWFIIRKKFGVFKVCRMSPNGTIDECRKFFNLAKACAVFIYNEIEDIRSY